MNLADHAILTKRSYTDAPTIGMADSASRMHVYEVDGFGTVHVFRGSDDIESWLHDFDVALVDVPRLGRLHAGFESAWQAIREPCMALPVPSAIDGHSLGAALAIRCAVEWALQGYVVPVHAFEPPRLCADGVMAALIKEKQIPWYACRNGRDIVTEVPVNMTLPGPLTRIGSAVVSFDNAIDHSIDRVIAALKA